MKLLHVLLAGLAVGWAASGVDWNRDAVAQEGELQFGQSKPARLAQPEGASPKSLRPVDTMAVAEAAKFGVGQVEVYKALTRVEIEELGGRGAKGSLNVSSDLRYLTAGLNALANDRWSLVTIESAFSYASRGESNSSTVKPSVYIFEKR